MLRWGGSCWGGVGHAVRQPKNDRSYLKLNIGEANNFPTLIHIPCIHYFGVWVICKRLNMNCIKIHSIILSVTCHGLRKSIPRRSDFDLLD